jgi:hypothetical protein
MKLRRSKPSARQRPVRDIPATPLNKTLYRARRDEPSINTGRKVEREAPQAAHDRLQFWLQRFGLIILLIAGLASVVNVVSLSNQAKVLPLVAADSGAFLRDTKVYETAATKLLAESVWNKNKITVDTGHISRELLQQYPELASVSVTIPLLAHRPLVYIQPGEPALILLGANGAFVIDNTGKALLKGDDVKAIGQPDLPLVNDQSRLRLELNKQALPASTVSFIREVKLQLAAKQFTAAEMNLPAAASQLDVKIAGQPYYIKFNLQTDTARQQAGTFLATITQLQKQNVTPSQYVDVRVPGRAYYQ